MGETVLEVEALTKHYAVERCWAEAPQFTDFGAEHRAACHNPGGSRS